jgi:cytochrome c oxidase cbb3-type subunit 3
MTAPDKKGTKPASGANGADRIMEHEYDGIKEYDNPMPRWWLLTFAGTVIFSVIYVFNVGPVGNGKGRIADYEDDMKAFAAAHPAPTGGPSAAQLMALVGNKEEVEEGKEAFVKNCVACHRADGGGMIGPNLTDDYWIHGASLDSVYTVVANGVLEKGMPPWGKVLSPKDLERVVAYVATLRGTNPPDPKAPQGVQVPQP